MSWLCVSTSKSSCNRGTTERGEMAEAKTVHSPALTYFSMISLLTLCPPFVILLYAIYILSFFLSQILVPLFGSRENEGKFWISVFYVCFGWSVDVVLSTVEVENPNLGIWWRLVFDPLKTAFLIVLYLEEDQKKVWISMFCVFFYCLDQWVVLDTVAVENFFLDSLMICFPLVLKSPIPFSDFASAVWFPRKRKKFFNLRIFWFF